VTNNLPRNGNIHAGPISCCFTSSTLNDAAVLYTHGLPRSYRALSLHDITTRYAGSFLRPIPLIARVSPTPPHPPTPHAASLRCQT
jgi:hypothetical protein